jgi:hypothetical protein
VVEEGNEMREDRKLRREKMGKCGNVENVKMGKCGKIEPEERNGEERKCENFVM